jgi:hypothetical protein
VLKYGSPKLLEALNRSSCIVKRKVCVLIEGSPKMGRRYWLHSVVDAE